jgi:hypothetical protein
MAKKKAAGRKSGGTAGIQTVDDDVQPDGRMPLDESDDASRAVIAPVEANGKAGKPERKPKAKAEPQGNGSFGVGEIRKAATFANSIGGLDKAIVLLQVLKVAKEVQ